MDRLVGICRERLATVVAAHPRAAQRSTPNLLVGLIGRGILKSKTPGMHEREAARLGLDCRYVLVDFDALGLGDEALAGMIEAGAALGFRGFNVTHPFKQRILGCLDALAPEADAIGAVNTAVIAEDGTTTGHNTDGWGFAEGFRRNLADAPRRRVALFGAGGAGAAVAHALLELGAGRLDVRDTDAARSEALVARLCAAWGKARAFVAPSVAAGLAEADGVVNATPVGMAKYPGLPFPAEYLRRGLWVADVVYVPEDTALLRMARALGCRNLGGTDMAIGQALRAFELFTGRKSDMAAMAEHYAAAA